MDKGQWHEWVLPYFWNLRHAMMWNIIGYQVSNIVLYESTNTAQNYSLLTLLNGLLT
jgi:hypothetical protein